MKKQTLTKIEWNYYSEDFDNIISSDGLFEPLPSEDFKSLERVYSIMDNVINFVLDRKEKGFNAGFNIFIYGSENKYLPIIRFGKSIVGSWKKRIDITAEGNKLKGQEPTFKKLVSWLDKRLPNFCNIDVKIEQ